MQNFINLGKPLQTEKAFFISFLELSAQICNNGGSEEGVTKKIGYGTSFFLLLRASCKYSWSLNNLFMLKRQVFTGEGFFVKFHTPYTKKIITKLCTIAHGRDYSCHKWHIYRCIITKGKVSETIGKVFFGSSNIFF